MLVVTVQFRIRPEHRDAFREVVLRQAFNSLNREPQCLQFDVSFDPESPGEVFLYEVYRDRAAFDEHLKTEHFHNFDTTVKDWVESKEVRFWNRAEPLSV